MYAMEVFFKVNAHFFPSTSKPLLFSGLELQFQELAEVWEEHEQNFSFMTRDSAVSS